MPFQHNLIAFFVVASDEIARCEVNEGQADD